MREGDTWRLYGDKWFCSNADAGLALVLAIWVVMIYNGLVTLKGVDVKLTYAPATAP